MEKYRKSVNFQVQTTELELVSLSWSKVADDFICQLGLVDGVLVELVKSYAVWNSG